MTIKPEHQAVLDQVEAALRHRARLVTAVRAVLDWVDEGGALYDPLADRHSVQLPGELVRYCRGAADPPQGL